MQIPMDNMIYAPSMNLVDIVVDEVALEGLDGITLEALWTRLSVRLDCPRPSLSESFMEQIWNICTSTKELIFYELPKPRPPLVLFNRYDYVDEHLGTILEPEEVPDDIYEHCPIDDIKNGIKGSCMDYETRKIIKNIREFNLQNANETFGNKLVIVGTQSCREYALMGDCVCPTIDLTMKQYCFLERIGRSRYHGEVTQGKRSLTILKEEPKSLFYHRKALTKYKLITKQMHHQKNSTHASPGSLLHLIRFYVEKKPKMIYLAEKIILMLKERPNCMIDIKEVKKQFSSEQMQKSFSKLIKTAFFRKAVVTTDEPYRALYPNAKKEEWQRKANTIEKHIRALKLIDPNFDINDLWGTDDTHDDDEYYELDISTQCVNQPLLKQANKIVESTRCDGISQMGLSKKMGLTRLVSRTIFRNLQRVGIVGTYINEVGRQRTTKFVSKKYEKNSDISKQYWEERDKMLEHTKLLKTIEPEKLTIPIESADNSLNQTDIDVDKELINNTDEKMEIDNENDNKIVNLQERNILFSHATMILKKYKLTKYKKEYKVTFKNLALNGELKKTKTIVKNEDVIVQVKKGIYYLNGMGKFMKTIKHSSTNEDIQGPSSISHKKLKRENIIIESLKQQKTIDPINMMAIINKQEADSGTRIDKKSLLRIIENLEQRKLIRNLTLIITSNGKKKSQLLICDLSVTQLDIDKAKNQARLKVSHPVPDSKKIKLNRKPCEKSPSKVEKEIKKKFIEDDIELPANMKEDRRAGHKYGFKPKLARMKILHLYLYYRIFEHSGEKLQSSRAEQLEKLSKNREIIMNDKLEKELPELYSEDIDWKMFIPPLLQKNLPIGWITISEIVYQMPLSLCLSLYNTRFIIPDLDEYINHPIRKHYLIEFLPGPIKKALMMDKKYISDIHESLKNLCYIGLCQLGPHRYKRKDDIEIYLNRKSELMNTIESSPKYYKIDADKNYPIEKYTFTSMQIVDEYWHRMHYICINTPLNTRLTDEGKEIIFEELHKKPEMIKTLQPRAYNETDKLDNGIMPGDKCGAAGIDSALFAHLKKNWDPSAIRENNNVAKPHRESHERERKNYLSKIEVKPIKFTDIRGIKMVCGPTNLDANELKVSKKKKEKKQMTLEEIEEKLKNQCMGSKGKSHTFSRVIKPRKMKQRKRVKYDDIDKSALNKMSKLRVDWSNREDNILLVCKVAMKYLCPNPKSQIITFSAVRDILHSYSPTSDNKTSRACQRRLLYMMKQPKTSISVQNAVVEVRGNYYINKKYGNIVSEIKKTTEQSERDDKYAVVFKELVAYVAEKYYDVSQKDKNTDDHIHKITTIQEFNLIYELTSIEKFNTKKGFQYDIKSLHDIHSATLNSVIHSALKLENHTSWAYQLCKIYRQYPEYLLRNAINKIRSYQMISIKKTYETIIRKRGNFMPLSSSQYQFSTTYNQKFNMKLPIDIFTEAFDFLIKIIDSYDENLYDKTKGIPSLPTTTGGMIFAIYEFLSNENIHLNVDIPEHIIALDPNYAETDEIYARISKRYQDILTSLEELHFDRKKKNDTGKIGKNIKTENPVVVSTDAAAAVVDRPDAENVEKNNRLTLNEPSLDKQKTKKTTGNPRNFTWTNAQVKSLLFDEATGSQSEKSNNTGKNRLNYLHEDNGGRDFVTLQDGTVIEISEEDIEKEKSSSIDDEFYDIFSRTRDDIDISFDRSLINRLNVFVNRPSLRKTDAGINNGNNLQFLSTSAGDKSGARENEENEVSGNVNNREDDDDEEMEIPVTIPKRDDSTDVTKRCTRIALLKMREELNDELPNNHHAHEYFVVNAFGISYQLLQLEREKANDPNLITDTRLRGDITLFNRQVYEKVMEDLNKFAIFPKNITTYNETRKQLSSDYEIEEDDIDCLFKYVKGKHEQGATLRELTNLYYKKLGNKLYKILSCFTNERLFLRSGVIEARYIDQSFAEPWFIRSVKMKRLQRESLPPIPQSTVFVFDKKQAVENEEIPDKMKIDEEDVVEEEEEEGEEEEEVQEEEEGGPSKDKTSIPKIKRSIMKMQDIERAADDLDSNTSETVNVVIRPWIKVDGQINKIVLEKMLGSVLSHCLMNPGIFLTKIQERFSPALQPYHTRELVEILVKLGCLKLTVLQKGPSTLFSKSEYLRLKCPVEDDGSSEFDKEIIVDATVCAAVRFSTFLRQNNDQLKP